MDVCTPQQHTRLMAESRNWVFDDGVQRTSQREREQASKQASSEQAGEQTGRLALVASYVCFLSLRFVVGRAGQCPVVLYWAQYVSSGQETQGPPQYGYTTAQIARQEKKGGQRPAGFTTENAVVVRSQAHTCTVRSKQATPTTEEEKRERETLEQQEQEQPKTWSEGRGRRRRRRECNRQTGELGRRGIKTRAATAEKQQQK